MALSLISTELYPHIDNIVLTLFVVYGTVSLISITKIIITIEPSKMKSRKFWWLLLAASIVMFFITISIRDLGSQLFSNNTSSIVSVFFVLYGLIAMISLIMALIRTVGLLNLIYVSIGLAILTVVVVGIRMLIRVMWPIVLIFVAIGAVISIWKIRVKNASQGFKPITGSLSDEEIRGSDAYNQLRGTFSEIFKE